MAKRTKEQLAKKLQGWIKKHGGPTASLSSIRPNPDNPRTITEDALHKLCCQLADMPQTLQARCIVYDEQGIILGGNMRYAALGELGIAEVPENWLYCAKGLSEKEKQQFILVDNTGAGLWNWDILANEWNSDLIAEWGPVVPGWDVAAGEDEEQHLEAAEDDYDVPDGGLATDIVLGDLFEIGEHRLLCGDSTCSDTVAKLMDGEKADMVFTDPPYGVSYTGGHNEKKRKGIENDTLKGVDLTNLFRDSLLNADLFSKDYSAFYIWYRKEVETFLSFAELNLEVRAVICWYKIKSGLGAFMSQYIPNCEPCIYAFKKGKSPQWFGATDEKTVWELKKESKNDYHPTQKPVELPERAIKNSSKLSDIILDVFLGSGSTMVASHQLKRKCYGMELDPKYCQVIVDRMLKLDPSLSIKRNGKPYKPTQL